MKKSLVLYLLTGVILFSCRTKKVIVEKEAIEIDTVPEFTVLDSKSDVNGIKSIPSYQASNPRINDLIHTKLEVKFDWQKQYLLGEATLTFKPYFYPVTSLELDAKGFDIHALKMGDSPLKYTYDGAKISIILPKTYSREEIYTIFIEYTAKPNELESEGSSAITEEKGLYFINPLGTEKNKMPQIWTQGETESSSCWFPTIDSPNEKTTQEISITVQDKFRTLSNGKLISSTKNADGTRTDYWKQDLRHAPYLFMMAVGEFDITKDSWIRPDGSKMEVNYYTEKEFTPYAKDIFGKTPKMIQFFSDKLGVTYPWDKYSQIVVRNYVSGAMENTSATIHGDFLYQTDRELLDHDNESIIAHELFHHWFGDLVTCESWSNLPVNESFANYSQYIWDEFEHGREEADKNAYGEMRGYQMSAARSGYHNLIYFDYESEMEMFDGHSYNKGGRILHMLRYVVGDEAFFLSLKNYLNKRKFNTGEAHDLRLSFEEVTGKDLNWFFNQWFYEKGHPTLQYSQEYDTTSNKLTLLVEQKQDFTKFPLFKLPIQVAIYTNNKVEVKEIVITKSKQYFEFTTEKPLLVNFDANKVILASKIEKKPLEQWVYQLENAPLYLDKKEALDEIKDNKDEASVKAIYKMLSMDYFGFKNMAMSNLQEVNKLMPSELKATLMNLTKDKKSSVRANAYKRLGDYFGKNNKVQGLIENGLNDNSYKVIGASLTTLANSNPKKAMKIAKSLEKEKSKAILSELISLYSEYGTKENHAFFKKSISESTGFSKFNVLNQYSKYLTLLDEKDLPESYNVYQGVIENSSEGWAKMAGYKGLLNVKERFKNRISELETKLTTTEDVMKKASVEREINDFKFEKKNIESLFNTLRSKEKDKKVLEIIENM